jgi:hypothetical protein
VDAQPEVNVEREIAIDLARRGLPITPLIVLVGALIDGWTGAISAAIGVGIVLLNFLAAGLIVARAAKLGSTAVGTAALAGYIVRLTVIILVLWLLKDEPWINLPILGFTLVFTHVGLLFWEAKYLSITLAAPGLRPARPVTSGDQ